MNRADAAAMRLRVGTASRSAVEDAADSRATAGSQSKAFERLQAATRRIMAGAAATDDLFAPALMHVLTGHWTEPDEYSRYVTDALLDPYRSSFELDAMVALDWCWDALTPSTREQIIRRLPLMPERLDLEVSPLDHFAFYRALCALSQAITCYQQDRSLEEADSLSPVLDAAYSYLTGPFLEICRQRGAVPTSPANGIWEEADFALALELLRTGLGRNLWPEVADSFGRSMEHYFYAETGFKGLNHGFIHNDGTSSPARPALLFRGFVPAVPFVLARSGGDPVATWYAAQSLPPVQPILPDLERYAWVRVLYGPLKGAEAARRAAPLGRNFGGGWVAMRTGWEPGDTVLLFDAGQPFWRARQHFDAGHFLIYHRGRLTQQSGDDVTFEAVRSKDGHTLIGNRLGDWDEFFRSTIAHNCVTITDETRPQHLHGRPWSAAGNQRLVGGDYSPAEGDLAKAGRTTGQLIAFQANSFYSFAAADLTGAYPRSAGRQFVRSLLMVNGGAILVLDQLVDAQDRSVKTWHLQLPDLPELASSRSYALGGRDPSTEIPSEWLSGARQLFGVNRDAGIWEVRQDHPWLRVSDGEGSLWVRTLLPDRAMRRIVGGPRHTTEIPAGSFSGKSYCGGRPDSFEYRLGPASMLKALSASYKLGRPIDLGEQFGTGCTWGRYDVSPVEQTREVVFLHLLTPADRNSSTPPPVEFQMQGENAVVTLTLDRDLYRVELNSRFPARGRVQVHAEAGNLVFDKALERTVAPNLPIPGAPVSKDP